VTAHTLCYVECPRTGDMSPFVTRRNSAGAWMDRPLLAISLRVGQIFSGRDWPELLPRRRTDLQSASLRASSPARLRQPTAELAIDDIEIGAKTRWSSAAL
jgi:hypothetical protein